jgi:RNA polymerase sigma-70 factor (ECF subfamily)
MDLDPAGSIDTGRSRWGASRVGARAGDALSEEARTSPSVADAASAAAEPALISRILGGETRLYGTLVDRYQRRLYWSCLRLLRDADEAEDVVQEAFVRAYAHLSEYDPAYRFYSWIFSIARNLCLNRIRRRKLWNLFSFSQPGEAPELEAEEDTSANVENLELARALSACLEMLPRDQRECFELRHAEELSYAEIARTLHVPMGTVMSRLARAREKMRVCLTSKGVTG